MFKEERQQQILNILNEESYVSVNKLSSLLYISLPTVRRDLAELEKKGMIVRNHGGAMRLGEGAYKIPLEFRNNYKMSQKQNLCREAAEMIKNGDVIFIDASTSTMHIADFISAKDVLAVTNGIPVAQLLMEKGINTFLIGGSIAGDSLGCIGSYAEEQVAKFNFDIVFFSSYGVNEKGMIVDTSLDETSLRRVAFVNSNQKVFICTEDKYRLSAPYNVIDIKDVDKVISDKEWSK